LQNIKIVKNEKAVDITFRITEEDWQELGQSEILKIKSDFNSLPLIIRNLLRRLIELQKAARKDVRTSFPGD